MRILNWHIDSNLNKETADNYRRNFAISLKNKSAQCIIDQLTFDGIINNVSIKDIRSLINFIDSRILRRRISGVGLEVGGGPGTFSSVIASISSVKKMFNVEVCRPIIDFLSNKVSDFILGEESGKVFNVIGSFDNIELADSSVDFIFDFFSLHHSDNIQKTLTECNRILKSGGMIICLDKARPNSYSEADINYLLDKEYDELSKKRFGKMGQRFTRRMNGEKEYRLKDWKMAMNLSGFSEIDYFYLSKTIGRWQKIRELIGLLPSGIQILFTRLSSKPKINHKFLLERENTIFCKEANFLPKNISLIVAYKE
jgi:ubiquinone/menaquinone biosynthesis C-methylase UbiE